MTFPINRRRLYLAAWCHTSSPPARSRAPSPRAPAMSRAQQYNPLASDSQGAGAAARRDVRVPLGLKLAHLCSYAGLIAVNVGANLGWFGKTNAEVSEEWPVPITPAGCVLRCVRVDGEGGRGKGGVLRPRKAHAVVSCFRVVRAHPCGALRACGRALRRHRGTHQGPQGASCARHALGVRAEPGERRCRSTKGVPGRPPLRRWRAEGAGGRWPCAHGHAWCMFSTYVRPGCARWPQRARRGANAREAALSSRDPTHLLALGNTPASTCAHALLPHFERTTTPVSPAPRARARPASRSGGAA